MRLTAAVRQQLLEQNEGFSIPTSNSGKNFTEERIYTITGGQLQVRAVGKTSWADSRYDKTWIADEQETHRFLYSYRDVLNTDGQG